MCHESAVSDESDTPIQTDYDHDIYQVEYLRYLLLTRPFRMYGDYQSMSVFEVVRPSATSRHIAN